MSSFIGKCVVVTGAASGFGKAMSEKFAAAGACVVAADVNGKGAEAVAAELPEAISFQVDVSSEDQNRALIEETVGAFGQIDVFCANAGIKLGKFNGNRSSTQHYHGLRQFSQIQCFVTCDITNFFKARNGKARYHRAS